MDILNLTVNLLLLPSDVQQLENNCKPCMHRQSNHCCGCATVRRSKNFSRFLATRAIIIDVFMCPAIDIVTLQRYSYLLMLISTYLSCMLSKILIDIVHILYNVQFAATVKQISWSIYLCCGKVSNFWLLC